MIDILKLEYVLKKRGITREMILKAEDWSGSTYYRKMSQESDWTIAEVNALVGLGVDITEVIDIFF